MLLGDTEAKCTHRAEIEDDPLQGFEQLRDAQVVVRDDVAQFLEYVAAAAPGDVAQIRTIRHPEVLERNEEALVDGLPKPQLDRDTVLKPLRDVFAVEALWRCREAQQFFRRKMVQEPVVRDCRSVVELIDDDDVEGVRSDPSKTIRVERLNHREDVPTCATLPSP